MCDLGRCSQRCAKGREMSDDALLTTLTCPNPACRHQQRVMIPSTYCQLTSTCRGCSKVHERKTGICCGFCSYTEKLCPSMQGESPYNPSGGPQQVHPYAALSICPETCRFFDYNCPPGMKRPPQERSRGFRYSAIWSTIRPRPCPLWLSSWACLASDNVNVCAIVALTCPSPISRAMARK